MSYTKKIVQGSTMVFLLYLAGGFIGYILRVFLARTMSVADFGLFYAIMAMVATLSIIRDPGLSSALTKYVAEFKAKADMQSLKSTIWLVIGAQLVIALVVSAVVFFLSQSIAETYFKTAEAVVPLQLITLTYLLSAFVTLQYVFLGLGKTVYYSFVEPFRNTVTFLFVFLLVGFGINGVAAGYAIGSMILVIALVFLMSRFKDIMKPSVKITKELSKNILFFSLPVFLTGVAGTILGYTDTIVITALRSVEEVGYYQPALSTSQLLWVLSSSVAVVLFPIVTEMWTKKERNKLSSLINLVVKFSFIIIIPAVMIIFAFPDVIIRTLFGEKFMPAAPSLQALALSSLFYPIFSIAFSSLNGIGKPSINTKIIAFMAVADIILNVILVSSMGIVGAAISTTLLYALGTFVAFGFLRKYVEIRINIKDMVMIFLSGIVSLIVILVAKGLMNTNPWVELVISVALGFAAYSLLIISTGAVSKEEAEILKETNSQPVIIFLKFFYRGR